MKQHIKMLLLFIILILGITTYKVLEARDVTSCEEYKDIKEFARCEVTKQWSEEEYVAFYTIIQKESNWTHNKEHNPSLSSAYGLGGFLNSTWENVGCVKTDDVYVQITCTIKYTQMRYGSASKALLFHTQNGWY